MTEELPEYIRQHLARTIAACSPETRVDTSLTPISTTVENKLPDFPKIELVLETPSPVKKRMGRPPGIHTKIKGKNK